MKARLEKQEGSGQLSDFAVSRSDVGHAYDAIRRQIRKTPILSVDADDFACGLKIDRPLVFKLECLQHTGSFKPRGALTHMATREIPKSGIVAASGGNHGAAAAFAARQAGVPATIFVPSIASPAKIARIKAYGADLVVAGDRYADALSASEDFVGRTGAAVVHAYDQPETISGQGTVALELVEQCDVDTILVSTGGGGLVGGMAAYLEGRVRLIAVEPVTAPTLHAALAAGGPVDVITEGVAADSLGAKRIGDKVYPLARAYVERSVLVSDAAIIEAQADLWRTLRVVVEPGGAAAFAALTSGAYRPNPDERVAVVLCGANTAAVQF
ncbi:MAG: threonine/serine dehydratase [Hyphomicrobiaceae bacterium]